MNSSALRLNKINPKLGEKFSPNLFAYLKKQKAEVWNIGVWRDSRGTLWLGFLDDGFLIGDQLNHVLCNGRKARPGCFGIGRLEEQKDFWSRYEKLGRCAIDTEHSTAFLNASSRFKIIGSERVCQWCGKRQYRHVRTEVIEHVHWSSIAPEQKEGAE